MSLRVFWEGEVLILLFRVTKYVLKWIPCLPLRKAAYGYSLGELVNLDIPASAALSIQLGAWVTGKLSPSQILVPFGVSKITVTVGAGDG